VSPDLSGLVAHARWMPAADRALVAHELTARQPAGSVLVVTCHRVEMYGSAAGLGDLPRQLPRMRSVAAADLARHLVRLAVGRESAVIAEDQVLHQLRFAVHAARGRGGLPRHLDRLLDLALRAGRTARSWLPATRLSLVEIALIRAIGEGDVRGRSFIVVGSGEMGERAAAYLLARGGTVTVASRTVDSARALADRAGVAWLPFDPGPDELAGCAGIVIALAGRWTISDQSSRAIAASDSWVVDISAPAALDEGMAGDLGQRLVTIDDLVSTALAPPSARLLDKLDALIERTITEYDRWLADEARRAAADALARRAEAIEAAELDRLWQRMPTLDQQQRIAVEQAIRQLTRQLLRDPLEQLGNDGDGSHTRAARDLFRL